MNIICPVYTPGTHEDDAEKYIIYNVSKEEYDTCRITNPNPRIIAVCDKPYKLMYFTITFRSFTPQPGGLEFRPGQDYYFICTFPFDLIRIRIFFLGVHSKRFSQRFSMIAVRYVYNRFLLLFFYSDVVQRRFTPTHRWTVLIPQHEGGLQGLLQSRGFGQR